MEKVTSEDLVKVRRSNKIDGFELGEVLYRLTDGEVEFLETANGESYLGGSYEKYIELKDYILRNYPGIKFYSDNEDNLFSLALNLIKELEEKKSEDEINKLKGENFREYIYDNYFQCYSPHHSDREMASEVIKELETEIDKLSSKLDEDEASENKKAIIDQYKKQLEVLSQMQEDLTTLFKVDEINKDEYLKEMCETNDRIMEILKELKIESEYIPF